MERGEKKPIYGTAEQFIHSSLPYTSRQGAGIRPVYTVSFIGSIKESLRRRIKVTSSFKEISRSDQLGNRVVA